MAYYLGRWFRKNELPAVFAIYVIGAPLAGKVEPVSYGRDLLRLGI